jgi:diguanylate cyclase (GGDEF)-like protein
MVGGPIGSRGQSGPGFMMGSDQDGRETSPAQPFSPEVVIEQQFVQLLEHAKRIMNAEPARALALGQEALSLAVQLHHTNGEAKSRRVIGLSHYWLAEYDQARTHTTDAYQHYLGTGDLADQASCLNLLGMISYKTGDYFTALENTSKALELRMMLGDEIGQSQCQNNLAMIHELTGDYSQALERYLKSLESKRKFGDSEGQANSLLNIAAIYQNLGQYELTRSSLIESQAIFVSSLDVQGQVFVLVNLGELDRRQQKYAESLVTLDKAEALIGQLGKSDAMITLLYTKAMVFKETGRNGEAMAALQEGLELARQNNEPYHQAEGLINIGQVQMQAGELTAAETSFREALAVVAGIQSNELLLQLYQSLSELYEQVGDHRQALEEYKRFRVAERQILNRDLEAKIKGLTVAHELEQARSEKEIYRLRNTELAELNRSLQEADQLKNNLLAQQRQQSHVLELLAREDSLTGLFNRRYLDTVLAMEFARARRFDRSLSVVMADIDHFKQINDRYGHPAGDRVLKAIAQTMLDCCREIDWVARYGGEEFVLVLPETEGPRAVSLCQRILKMIEEQDWHDLLPGGAVTISMGVTDDRAVTDSQMMLAAADANLYRAKHAGRNRVIYQ